MQNDKTGSDFIFVQELTDSEVKVFYAASQVVRRVFDISSIFQRVGKDVADSTVYAAVTRLSEAGVFNIISRTPVISLTFTPYGRSLCGLVNSRINYKQELLEEVQEKQSFTENKELF